MLTSKDFWVAAGERAIKTFAQTLLALVGTNNVGLLHSDLLQAVTASAIAAGLSLLTSVSTAKSITPTK